MRERERERERESVMAMQTFSTLFISGFIILAVIGVVAVLHGLLFQSAQPDLLPQETERKLSADQQHA